jgi:hypothetical protein
MEWARGNDGRFRRSAKQDKQVAYDNEATLLPVFAGSGLAVPFDCESARKFIRPSLLLYGDHTRVWYRAVVTRFSKWLQNMEVAEIPNSTHFGGNEKAFARGRRQVFFYRTWAT